jgi:endonuclease/exonuclease/phosphatase family metal-dependent hydrolase
MEFSDFTIFLVHLSVKYRQRQEQLRQICNLLQRVDRPVVLAGDFNAFWGEDELELFLNATGLRNANRHGLPTYPSASPRIQLDFVFHSPHVDVHRLHVPQVRFSDHLPMLCDFTVRTGD